MKKLMLKTFAIYGSRSVGTEWKRKWRSPLGERVADKQQSVATCLGAQGETSPSFQIKKLECRIEMRQADGSTIPKEIP